MGLDKRWCVVFNGFIMTLLAHLGLGIFRVVARGLSVLGLASPWKGRVSPLTAERKRFEEEVRDQFLKLKAKGLGIRVFTL